MKILVTGGAGMIGANLCEKLLEKGHQVVAVDNLITGQLANIRPLLAYPNFTFIKHDITNPFPKNFKFKITNLKLIYHLACPTGVDNLGPLAQEMLLTCSVGTQNVLELARIQKAKFLLTSSSEVYGDAQVSPQVETYTGNVDPTGIRSPYEEGKRFAESITLMYVRKFNLDARVVRVFNTYGPKMSNKDTRVIPAFLHQALKGKPLKIHGKGMQTRTFCYVDDLIWGLELVMQKGKKAEVYNLGGDQQISILDLAKLVIELSGSKSTLKFTTRPKHDHQSRQPDLTKVKKLGWRQRVNLKDGIKRTINS